MRAPVLYALLATAGAIVGVRYFGAFPGPLFPDSGTEHGAWYASRASGITSYLLLWFATVAGILMSSAWFDGIVNRARLLAMHQTSAFAGLILGTGHALVLIPDGWTQFGPTDLFIPFASYYEPTETAIGTMSLSLFAIVTFSFWARGRIGVGMWRAIHFSSFVALGGAFWHGVSLGTDSEQTAVMSMYIATSLLLVTALGIRMTYQRPTPVRTGHAKETTPA